MNAQTLCPGAMEPLQVTQDEQANNHLDELAP